jgi:hypothetical protein
LVLSLVGGKVVGKATSAACFARWRLTSNSVTGRNAVRPVRKPSALDFQPWPKAVMIPAPVMATRGGVRDGDIVGKSMTGQRVERFRTGPGDPAGCLSRMGVSNWMI